MSRESHQRYLEQAALREAQKTLEKNAPQSLTRDSLGQLRIQTVEPWKRILLGLLSLLFLGPGISVIVTEPLWAGIVLSVIGVCILTLAILGRKKTIDAALDSVDVIHIATQLFDTL